MSNIPVGGTAEETIIWLHNNGFEDDEMFKGWTVDLLLKLNRSEIEYLCSNLKPGSNLRLWYLLEAVRPLKDSSDIETLNEKSNQRLLDKLLISQQKLQEYALASLQRQDELQKLLIAQDLAAQLAAQKRYDELIQKGSRKVGDNLSISDLDEFSPNQICNLNYSLQDVDTKKSHHWYQPIYDAVLFYTKEMIKKLESNHIDEEKYVQPNSFQFLKKLLTVCLNDKCSAANNSINNHMIKYNTILMKMDMTPVYVTGETDASVFYSNTCIMTWEDKNLNDSCNKPSYLGQQYAEVKGNAEKFFNLQYRQPRFFYGILTSGREWIFLLRTWRKGKLVWMRFESIFTIGEKFGKNGKKEFVIMEKELELLTIRLISVMESVAELMSVIDEVGLEAISPDKIVEGDDNSYSSDNNDNESNNNDDGINQEKQLDHIVQKMSSTTLGRGKNNNNNNNNTNKSSNKNTKQNSSKSNSYRSTLSNLNEYTINFTMENLARHQMILECRRQFGKF